MAASHKAALKAAKAALDAGRYDEAVEQAGKVLAAEPAHYHANVFQGLALEKQGNHDAAEEAYKRALKANKNDDSLVWQGLVSLYQQQASKKINEYLAAVTRLAEIHMRADDIDRCHTVVDKCIPFVKQHGTKDQYRRALDIMLPTSSLYDYLEGRLPHPGGTYAKVAELVEAEEKQRINRLIGERKTRLGARVGQVTTEVKREVFSNSNLEKLYEEVINWTNEDDIRRLYEEKLLQRAYDTMSVLPTDEKPRKVAQVQKLAEGVVILKHPFYLAWKIVLEWKDVEEISQMDVSLLRQYIELFPTDGLTKILTGFLKSPASPFPLPKRSEETVKNGDAEAAADNADLGEEDDLVLMTDGLEESYRSLLSQRVMAEYYAFLEEHASSMEAAKKAKDLINTEKNATGLAFQNSLDAVEICLGRALVHYQAPRHHTEARRLFENILKRKPEEVSCLIGIGLIYEEEEDYGVAADFLTKALERSPSVKIKAEAAWCSALAGDYGAGADQIQECLDDIESNSLGDNSFKAQCLYRLGMCKWNIDSSRSARKDRKGAYSYFLSALKLNLDYAPAYTILGIYYNDYGKDQKRARKCFQKAFELSPSEIEAAERLARSFADQGEWDLVEMVAQRVVDSGKTKAPPGSKKRGVGWPFAALGVCQINNLEYSKSIVSFQAALRSHPEDLHSWIGLGESYHNSGRYISATKAFEQVQMLGGELNVTDDTLWFAKYMLANVKRELGEYDQAIDAFEGVLSVKPADFSVSMSLLQTYVDASWRNVELGLFGRAAGNGSHAMHVAQEMVTDSSHAFNLWKAVSDTCAMFTWIESWISVFPTRELFAVLTFQAEDDHYSALSEIDDLNLESIQAMESSQEPAMSPSLAAVLANKRALHCASYDIHAQAVAWYNLGWSEYRAHSLLAVQSTQMPQKGLSTYIKASVKCFKRAIELEPGNSEFWNSLGIVTTPLNPKVAQHAFCRSLYINGNLARVWTNLGTLYLLQGDTDLAIEAFTRGQSSDPDYGLAWVGQGVLSLLAGQMKEAQNQFAHAFELLDSTTVVGKRLYSSSTFDELSGSRGISNDYADLLEPLFALHQLRAQEPKNVVAKHLSSLMAERASGQYQTVESLEDVCGDLESRYEASEAEADLVQFVQAQADLARANLAKADFAAASRNAVTALDLSAESDTGRSGPESWKKARLSAHLTAGLAYHYLDQSSDAIDMFRAALIESESNPDVVCMLAQVLWAKGGEEERATAREQLFDCIENHPDHASTIILLSVMAALDGDEETWDAVSTDLHGLRSRADIDARGKLKIGKLLSASAVIHSSVSEKETALLAEATASTFLTPSLPHGWAQLSNIAADSEPHAAEMEVLTALSSVPPRGGLDAESLARAYSNTGKGSDTQRSIMVAPWMTYGWEGLQ